MPFICKCQKIYKVNDKAFKFKLYFDSYKSSMDCGQIDRQIDRQINRFPIWIPYCNFHSPDLLDSLFLMLVFLLKCICLHWKIQIMWLSQFPLTFNQTQNWMPHFIAQLMIILMMIWTVFVIICEVFHEKLSFNSVLLLLLVNFVSGFKL